MVYLPVDLIGLIVRLSVDPIDIDCFASNEFADRFSRLYFLATISSEFKYYASPLLQEYVIISNDKQEIAFAEGWENNNPFTKVLVLESKSLSENRGSLALERVPNLEHLRVKQVKDFSMQSLENLPLLKSLQLHSSNIFGDGAVDFQLPLLTRLECHGVGFMNSALSFLAPGFLPILTSMSLHRISASSLPDLDSAFVAIAPQLLALSTDAVYVYGIVLEHARALLLVDLSSRWELEELFDDITPNLRFIRVHHNGAKHHLENTLNLIARYKAEQANQVESVKADGEVDSHNSAMIEVKERLASLSITLKVGTHLGGSGIGFWKEVDEMEKVLATERKKD